MLGQRVMKEGGESPRDRIGLAFRLATSRSPEDHELEILLAEFQDRLKEFSAAPEAAKHYLDGGGEKPGFQKGGFQKGSVVDS